MVAFDADHSPRWGLELRWWLLGKVDDRVMLVRYTHRPNGVIPDYRRGLLEIRGANL